MAKRIIRLPEVMARTGLSQSTIYQFTSTGRFPAKIPLGSRAVGWDADEVEAWINERSSKANDHECVHIDRAAAVAGLQEEQLKALIECGALPTHRVGRHVLIRKVDLEALNEEAAC